MSTIVLKSQQLRPSRIQPVLDWLRQARVAASLPLQNAEALSDSYLRDVGLRREDVARTVTEAPQRLGLLDLGWQGPRQQRRR
ncbi:MAG TPA: hypothetical protein VGV39_26035 [Mesorhizobium sp.]|jgi:uncharacterized protein YjiS (DUF1127 family)|uniref:hypothetical protein n=1 Tax=Mesorhizobium sp. TaxID=1871066 RepID=UPI002DDD6C05|nr:hypothetical protein [Mesorhizobium sp.]HEV2506560.1 hypothetical protein [Mesorhizobium sp.]